MSLGEIGRGAVMATSSNQAAGPSSDRDLFCLGAGQTGGRP